MSDLRSRLLEQIDADLALAEKATPGPWSRDYAEGHPGYTDGTHDYQVWDASERSVCDVGARDPIHENGNADFIARSRTGWPAALRALRAEVERHAAMSEHAFVRCDICGLEVSGGLLDPNSFACPFLLRVAKELGVE